MCSDGTANQAIVHGDLDHMPMEGEAMELVKKGHHLEVWNWRTLTPFFLGASANEILAYHPF